MSMTINSMNSLFSSIFGWNSQNSDNSSQTMFGQDTNLGINLSDYASIKSGAYHKLLKAYYENVPDDDKKTDSSSKKNTQTTQKEKVEELTRVENAADDVKDAADALLTQGNKSVFHKVEKTGTDGKITLGYDTDAIYKAVDKFVSSYNTMIDRGGDSENERVLKTTLSAVQNTKKNEDALNSIGITIGSDNKLSIDADEFKAADMDTVKSLFNKTASFGYQTSANASMLSFYAERAASQASTYGANGTYTYNYQSGNLYDTGI